MRLLYKPGVHKFSKDWERPPNSRRQNVSQDIRRHFAAFIGAGDLAPGICSPPEEDQLFSYVYGDSRCVVTHSSVMCMETVAVL